MDLKEVNESIVSVILNLEDYKNLYSRNHAFSLRFNGKTITNSTGIAFQHNHKIYVICDGNIFAPYSKQSNFGNDIEITVLFNHKFSRQKQNKYPAQIINVQHLAQLQSGIESIDRQFKFGYLNHNNIHSHLKHKFGFLMLLKLIDINCKPHLFEHIISLESLQNASISHKSPSTLIGKSIFSISNPFGILCSNVLCNTVHHGILSTNLLLQNNDYIWLSDMKYLPGMEGGIIITCNHNNYNQFLGMLSIPLMIGNNATLTTIIPSHIIFSWLIHNSKLNNFAASIVHHSSSLNTSMTSSNKSPTINPVIYNATQSVLPICIGSHWGSGVLISTDHILTNAHIIRPYLTDINEKDDYVKRVELKSTSRYDSPKIGIYIGDNKNNNRNWLQCKVIYVTHKDSAWDLAWLRIIEYKDEYEQFMHPIKVNFKTKYEMNKQYKNIFEQRSNVFVIGYGLIHPSRGLSPLVSGGILSKIVEHKNNVIILKTSADIHAGHSGGLLCDNNGYCLGLLTNNSIFDFDTNKSAMNTWEKERLWRNDMDNNPNNNNKYVDNKKISFIYPNLNSVIPFSVIYPLYECIIDGGNNVNVDKRLNKVFQALDKPNTKIQAKWNLISPEKLEHELRYEKKMESIMNSIPKHLLNDKKDSKL